MIGHYSKELDSIREFMSNEKVRSFVLTNLKESMDFLGHSKEFIRDLEELFDSLDIKRFTKEHNSDLIKYNTMGWVQVLEPEFFEKYVIPNIPQTNKLLDIGCGTGILLHILKNSDSIKGLLGIDIDPYPEWENYRDERLILDVVKPGQFDDYLKKCGADGIVMTWALHHMEYAEQKKYLDQIYISFEKITLTILEDTYSDIKPLMEDIGSNEEFRKLTSDEKKMVLSVNDWLANRVLLQRWAEPIPFQYRSIEEWEEFFREIGFKIKRSDYIGFPKGRDVNNPQGLFVIEK